VLAGALALITHDDIDRISLAGKRGIHDVPHAIAKSARQHRRQRVRAERFEQRAGDRRIGNRLTIEL
jgi:hypothetical protein